MDGQIGSVNVPQSLDLEVLQDGLKAQILKLPLHVRFRRAILQGKR